MKLTVIALKISEMRKTMNESDITLKMLFDLKEIDDIHKYCYEKGVPLYDLIRNTVLEQLCK